MAKGGQRPKREGANDKRLELVLPDELLEAARIEAAHDYMSLSAWLRGLIKKEVDRRKKHGQRS